jgi:hypothetical protein
MLQQPDSFARWHLPGLSKFQGPVTLDGCVVTWPLMDRGLDVYIYTLLELSFSLRYTWKVFPITTTHSEEPYQTKWIE